MNKFIYVISIVAENELRVLQRITTVLARHRLNIIHMNVHKIHASNNSYFNMTFQSETKTIDRVMKQLNRIIELLEVTINSQVPLQNSNLERASCQ